MTPEITNQQLAFARIQTQAGASAKSPVVRLAHCQAAILQLVMALESYLVELEQLAKLKCPIRPVHGMFKHIQHEFEAQGYASAELDEWVDLEQDAASWLSILLRWRENVRDLKVAGAPSVLGETSLTEQAVSADGLIRVVDVGGSSDVMPAVDASLLQTMVTSVSSLIERQRSNNLEY